MEFKLCIKKKTELLSGEISEIIALKQQFWKYSVEEQKRWFYDNIFDDDLNFLLYEDGNLLAYLNAVQVESLVNDIPINIIGIGNVCVSKNVQHRGLGRMLMQAANIYIKNSNSVGALLCKKELIDFYKNSNWVLLNPEKITIGGKKYNNFVMVYGVSSIKLDAIKRIEFSRNF